MARRGPAGSSARVALLFPGQGSQTRKMRDIVAEHRPDLLKLAEAEVGCDPFERVGDGTQFAQPALYAASLACWERAGRPDADFFAGHSLGELAALAAAGGLDEHDGLKLASSRGALMNAAAAADPGGAMIAVLAEVATAEGIAEEFGLTVANRNAPDQTVLSGADAAIAAAAKSASDNGVRAIRLPVQGAFHSAAMGPAVEPFRQRLAEFEFRTPRVPVISCLTAKPFVDPRAGLADALTQPVLWLQTLNALQADGVTSFIEAGPGKVLANLTRRSLTGVSSESLDRAMAASA